MSVSPLFFDFQISTLSPAFGLKQPENSEDSIMIMKSGLLTAVFSIAANLALTGTVPAALPVQVYTFNNNELLLGFTIAASTSDLTIDLGTATQVGVGGTKVVDLNANGNVGKTAAQLVSQLNSLYGNMNRLTWGVVGGHFSGNSTIYATVPQGSKAPVLGPAGNLTSAIDGLGSSIDGSGTPPNQQVADPTSGLNLSFTEWIVSPTSLWRLGASDPTTTTSSSFATGGAKSQVLDLYQQDYNGSLGLSPVYVGFFTLGNDGSLTFSPATSTPPTNPPPAPLLSIHRAGNTSTISFASTNGATYSLFYTNTAGLSTPTTNWALSATQVTGDGGIKAFTDNAPDADRVFRVMAK